MIKSKWDNLPRWIQVCTLIVSLSAVLGLVHRVIGIGYVWGLVCEPRACEIVDRRVEPMEDAGNYLIFMLREIVPDSVAQQADKKYAQWKRYELRNGDNSKGGGR